MYVFIYLRRLYLWDGGGLYACLFITKPFLSLNHRLYILYLKKYIPITFNNYRYTLNLLFQFKHARYKLYTIYLLIRYGTALIRLDILRVRNFTHTYTNIFTFRTFNTLFKTARACIFFKINFYFYIYVIFFYQLLLINLFLTISFTFNLFLFKNMTFLIF